MTKHIILYFNNHWTSYTNPCRLQHGKKHANTAKCHYNITDQESIKTSVCACLVWTVPLRYSPALCRAGQMWIRLIGQLWLHVFFVRARRLIRRINSCVIAFDCIQRLSRNVTTCTHVVPKTTPSSLVDLYKRTGSRIHGRAMFTRRGLGFSLCSHKRIHGGCRVCWCTFRNVLNAALQFKSKSKGSVFELMSRKLNVVCTKTFGEK